MESGEKAADNFIEPQTEGMDLTVTNKLSADEENDVKLEKIEPIEEPNNEIKNSEPAVKKKRKKSRKIKRSIGYPKFYRNAYVRYCDEFRPKVCEENPDLDAVEITKLVASKWYALPKEEKEPYINDAKVDKNRFERELLEYKSLNPDECDEKAPTKKQKLNNKETKEKPATNHIEKRTEQSLTASKIPEDPIPSTSTASNISKNSSSLNSSKPSTSQQMTVKRDDEIMKVFIGQNCEIPIFTDVFLEHNKAVETELKALRKNNIEIEQQNSVLMKHIENMENGVVKVESEIADVRKKNMQLEVYLTKLRVILSANFNCLQIPGWKGGATVENIDKYMSDLAASSTGTLNKARDILKKIDLQI